MLGILAEADPYFTVKLHDKTGVEKDEIILKCEVSKDVPVRWFKDGEEIVPSPKHSVKTDGLRRILKIKKAELKDKGEYVCDCGTDTTKANVTVEGELAPNVNFPTSETAVGFGSISLTELRYFQLDSSRWKNLCTAWKSLLGKQPALKLSCRSLMCTASGN